jgi:hypothetical protein
LLRIEHRLVCDADGERVWFLVKSLRVLGWARPKSYAGDLVLVVVVGLDRVQSGGGLLNAGELAAELGVDGGVFS